MSTRDLAARLGIDDDDLPDVGQRLLSGVADLAHDDVVANAQLAQAAAPVARAAQVADDDDQCALARMPARPRERLAQAVGRLGNREVVGAACHLAQLHQHADEADAPLARRHEERFGVAIGEQSQSIAATARDVADREYDALGDVGLPAQRRAEAHRRRGVEHDPGRQGSLGHVQPHVRLVHPRRCVPVDQADVVTRLVGPHLRELHGDAERRRAMIAREQALDAAPDGHVERAQRGLGHGARTRPRRSRRRDGKRELAHATSLTSSTRGMGTVSSTGPITASALTPSASARYDSTSRWRIASGASSCTSEGST